MSNRFSKMSVWVDLDDESQFQFEVEPGGETVLLHMDDVDIYARTRGLQLLANTVLEAQRAAWQVEVEAAQRLLKKLNEPPES